MKNVPEGWKLVPVKPTLEMKIAGDNAGFWCGDKYAAMLAASPQPVEQTESMLTDEQIEDLEEAREILENMARSVEIDGNYSTEATCTFLRQVLLCLQSVKPAREEPQ